MIGNCALNTERYPLYLTRSSRRYKDFAKPKWFSLLKNNFRVRVNKTRSSSWFASHTIK